VIDTMEEKRTRIISKNICIVIPVFNEAPVIQTVLENIKKCGNYTIIVVDDDSSDDSYKKAVESNVYALRHSINRGQGAAIKTGVEAAKYLNAEIIITMDADGQHNPNDINRLLKAMEKHSVHVVLGSRCYTRDVMPIGAIVANKIANFITWSIYGIRVRDSQCGFRVYSRQAVNILKMRFEQYEYSSILLGEIHSKHLSFVEEPIETIYTSYSKSKKNKQNITQGIKTVYNLLFIR